MFIARLICSDPACAAETASEAATLRELEALACDCGCAFAIIGFPDWTDDPEPTVLAFRPRRGTGGLPEAA